MKTLRHNDEPSKAIREAKAAYNHFLTQQPDPKPGDLRVWWIPQIPMGAFRFHAPSPKEAKSILDCLCWYDQFQLANNIKPDYSNMGGLEVFDGTDWNEWEDSEGLNIDETETFSAK